MELVWALIAAVVSGAIAALVAWVQTRATFRRELELHEESLSADSRSNRLTLTRTAAADALTAVAALDAAMPHMDHRFAFLGSQVPGYVRERRVRAERAVAELRRAEIASLPLLDPHLQSQWTALVVDADTASRVEIGSSESRAAADELRGTSSEVHRLLVAVLEKDPDA